MTSRLDLGVGIVALGNVDLLWPAIAEVVDVVEVEPQTLWHERPGGWALDAEATRWLAGIERPLLAHGVGFPVGGQVPPDERGVELFSDCVGRFGALHASEHLAFNRTDDGRPAGFLLPPRQNWATVDAAVDHIGRYQRSLDVPFPVESGVSYLRPRPDELDDATFLTEIVERADCGLLLDLHNLLANERNGRQPARDVVAALPVERVLEVHVAGGFTFDGLWLDAHSGPCDDELLALLAEVLPRLPNVRAVIFEALPPFLAAMGPDGVRHQLGVLHAIVDAARRHRRPPTTGTRRRRPRRPRFADAPRELDWQRATIDFTTRRAAGSPGDDHGFGVLRALTDQARLGRLAVAARPELEALRDRLGPAGAQAVVERYLADCDAELWTAAEGAAFLRWLAVQEGSDTPLVR